MVKKFKLIYSFINLMFLLIIWKFHLMYPNHISSQSSQIHSPPLWTPPKQKKKKNTISYLCCSYTNWSMFKLPVAQSSSGVTITQQLLAPSQPEMVPFQTFLVWKEGSQKFILISVNSYTLKWNCQTWEWVILSWYLSHSWEFLPFPL